MGVKTLYASWMGHTLMYGRHSKDAYVHSKDAYVCILDVCILDACILDVCMCVPYVSPTCIAHHACQWDGTPLQAIAEVEFVCMKLNSFVGEAELAKLNSFG
eukprot:1572807-Rhodomonas_salina.1